MTDAKDREYYQTYLQNLDDEDSNQIENFEIIRTETPNFDTEVGGVDGDVDNNASIIMDADGNCYYQSSEKIIKVVSSTKAFDIPEKKLSSAAVPSSNKSTNASAQIDTVSLKKSKLLSSIGKKAKQEENDVKSVDDTIISEIGNQEEVYEFDENEENPDDPGDVTDPDYKYKGIIKNEKKAAANESSFTCMICSYQTNKKFLLSRHLKTHSDERPFKCSVCERGFKSSTALGNHRNTHLGYKPHACSSCDMAFTTSGELVRHVRYRHTRIKPHKCTECDYSSVEMSKLRRHMRCHTGERPYQCPHCTYASPDTFKLKRHMRIHTGEKPYECDICHSRFTQSNSLKHHRLIHSVNDKPVFQCHLCPTTCGRKTDLRLHIKKLHSSDQPIPCKRCGKELPDRYSYKMHMKTHEGEKCYRCEYCPYAAISSRHLESHVLIHLNVKPFLCEICQNSFRQKSLLTRHIKIYHLDNYEPPQPRKKVHKCPHCNKLFAFNGNLIRHMEIHDPTSRLLEYREKLRMGRLKRVKPNGDIETVLPSNSISNMIDDNTATSCDETQEKYQFDDVKMQEEYEETEEYDGENIQYVYDDYDADEYGEQYEEEQYEQQLDQSTNRNHLMDVKQEKREGIDTTQTSLKKTIVVKAEEENESEIMSLEVQDGQGFMVIEVLSDDDDEDQEEEEFQHIELQTVKPTIINKKANQSIGKESPTNSQTLIADYFGFEVNAEEEDEETKGAIKLLEMIEQE